MNAFARPRSSPRGFTLVELLVVIGVMAVLAGILLPVISVVQKHAKNANTEALIARVGTSLAAYRQEQQVYPPDYVPSGAQYYYEYTKPDANGFQSCWNPNSQALPPEALYYYLTNPFVARESAYLLVRAGAEAIDCNRNGLLELVDAWGRPLLYNRAKFPGQAASYFNYTGASPYEDSDGKPWHNKESFDLYSVGVDGLTNAKTVAIDPIKDLIGFVRDAIGPTGGVEGDDLNNW
jgi:prepilin-type N-terminal cleavage/methylation domain-containing protein